jgi:hypothetical protein
MFVQIEVTIESQRSLLSLEAGQTWSCFAADKGHVDEPDVSAAPAGAGGYAEWVESGRFCSGSNSIRASV